MPEAKCPKCGTQYFGWALLDPKHQKCKKCGAQLEVLDKGQSGSVAKQEPGVMEREKGFSLLEVMIAIALMGIIVVAFLGALATGSKAIFIADERATAESIARSQMEYVKSSAYEPYDPSSRPSYTKNGESSTSAAGYFIWVDAFPIDPDTGALSVDPNTGIFLTNPDTGEFYQDGGIQKIIVTIKHGSEAEVAKVIVLEGYKVDR